MENTIIYFAVFQSSNMKHDRFTRYRDVTPPDFLDWIQEQRKELERGYGNCCVLNANIIKL